MSTAIEQVNQALVQFSAASPGKAVRRPSDEEIIAVVAEHFGVSPAVAAGWLSTIREAA